MSKSDPDFWRDGDPTGEGAPDSEVSDDYAAKYLRKPRKRAAIIVTDADTVVVVETWVRKGAGYTSETTGQRPVSTSEQLLADLRLVCDLAEVTAYDSAFFGEGPEDYEALMRVRALLPKEEGEHE